MSGSTRKPTVVLSLVKDQGDRARFISLESLDTERRELVQKYHRLVAPQSVLVGAVLSASATWDIRPVYLHRGTMMVSRVFSAELYSSPSMRDELKSFIFQVERLFVGSQSLMCGSAEGYAWTTRKYFNYLLSDNNIEIPLTSRPKLIRDLLLDIQKLHANGFIHGHIQPHNIAYENDRFILLDFGIHIKDPSVGPALTLAPELRESVAAKLNATTACDLYGIGLVAKRLFGGELLVEYGNLIEVLLLQDPKLRPSLDQVLGHFSEPQLVEPEQAKVTDSNVDSKVFVPKATAGIDLTRYRTVGVKGLSFLLSKTFLAIVVAITLIFVGKNITQKVFYPVVQIDEDQVESFAKLWDSGQSTLMQQVVEKALSDDSNALYLLRDRLQKPVKNAAIQQRLFTIAFHPFWLDQITDKDIKALLIYGTPSLVPVKLRHAPELGKLHPAVSLAVAASIPPENNFLPFKDVTTTKLGSLPSIYGTSYLALKDQGIKDLSEISAQSLAHILTADFSPSIIQTFLSVNEPGTSGAVSFSRLSVLVPLFSNLPGLEEKILESVAGLPDHPLSWFGKDVVAGWAALPAAEKINIFLGQFPDEITFEQNVDLLRFPLSSIRELAKQKLLAQVGNSFSGVITFLSGNETPLTRTQAISLLATFLVPSEKSKNFVLQWFDTEPNPESIKTLLVLRPPSVSNDDPFNITAARYLLSKEVSISLKEAKALLRHQEALVRALAYSKLPVETAADKEQLKELLKGEKDKGLLARQLERLKE